MLLAYQNRCFFLQNKKLNIVMTFHPIHHDGCVTKKTTRIQKLFSFNKDLPSFLEKRTKADSDTLPNKHFADALQSIPGEKNSQPCSSLDLYVLCLYVFELSSMF